MTINKKFIIQLSIITITFSILNFTSFSKGYLFGIKSFDDTIDNIQQIEQKYNFNFPIIAFLFDPWSAEVSKTLNKLNQKLGTGRIYHITISPNPYSAKEVSKGKFDKQYLEFFDLIKKNNLKVIFRTMHEMNGGRYPRSSDPKSFKEARQHVWKLSRELGLNQSNILFDMSINHRDMPSIGSPSQSAKLITCTPNNKYTDIIHKIAIGTGYKTEYIENKIKVEQSGISSRFNSEPQYYTVGQSIQIPYTIYKTEIETKQNCFSFEDYYPGDKYVDILGITFYNRGKASYNRLRQSPNEILNNTIRNTLNRLKSFHKPIFIDEVATTAVYYNGAYNQKTSQKIYQENTELKNKRLISLKDFMLNNPEILGMIYFNIDYTKGLTNRMIGEADRAIINLDNDKYYTGTDSLYQNQNSNNKLYNLFQINDKISPLDTVSCVNCGKEGIGEIGRHAQILATALKNKFGIEESLYRLNRISKTIKNDKVKNVINQTIEILKK